MSTKKDDGFLPSDYQEPEGNYMSFKEGENTFRVLSSAITGFEYWKSDNTPVRSKTAWETTPKDIRMDKGKPTAIKHFWAFVVWNYGAKKVQILQVAQRSIQKAIKAYVANKQWGDPKKYDITVTKSGSGLDTEYVIMANPPSPAPEVKFEINLDAIFEDGGDPFASKEQNESNAQANKDFKGEE